MPEYRYIWINGNNVVRMKAKMTSTGSFLPTSLPSSFLPFTFFIALSLSPPLFLNKDLLVWQRNDHLHVVEREESRLATQRAFIPVFINLIGQIDDVPLVEAQFAFVLRIEVIESFTARLLCCYKEGWRDLMRMGY